MLEVIPFFYHHHQQLSARQSASACSLWYYHHPGLSGTSLISDLVVDCRLCLVVLFLPYPLLLLDLELSFSHENGEPVPGWGKSEW